MNSVWTRVRCGERGLALKGSDLVYSAGVSALTGSAEVAGFPGLKIVANVKALSLDLGEGAVEAMSVSLAAKGDVSELLVGAAGLPDELEKRATLTIDATASLSVAKKSLATLKAMREKLSSGGLREVLTSTAEEPGAGALVSRLLEGHEFEITARYPIKWHCPCSKDRVTRALLTLGKDELKDILVQDKKAEATCQFCSTTYVVTEDELKKLISAMA